MNVNARLTAIGVGAAMAVISLSACSGTSNTSAGNTEDSGSTKIALVPGTKGSPFYEAMACGAKDAAEELGVQVTVSAPDTWGAAQQLPVLDSVAADRPDALLVVPTDKEALTSRLQTFKDEGIPIVELDQRITDESLSVSKIASDDHEGGRLAARALAEQIGGSGKVMAISSPPGTDQQYIRVEGFVAELEENYPDIEYIGEQQALNDVTAASGFVTSTLASDPDLAGIFVGNDVNAIGAITGLEEAGAVGDVKVVAYDAAESEIEALKKGALQALIAQDPYGEGYQGVEQAMAALNGEETEADIAVPLTTLTADDTKGLEEYIARNGGC